MSLPTIEDIRDSRMRWFGESWGAPLCETELQIAVPVGLPCAYCEEAFVATDRGITMLHVGFGHRAKHIECNLVSIIGHVSCQLQHPHNPHGVCTGPRDPKGMSKRQAAKLAIELAQLHDYRL